MNDKKFRVAKFRAKERIQNIFSKNKKDKISDSELENLINEGKVPVEIKNNF